MFPFLLLSLLLWSAPVPATAFEFAGECTVSFTGFSTLHDFDGTAACTPFVLAPAEGSGSDVRLGEVMLSVPVAGMRTGIALRDRQMREMFDAGRFPQITGRLGGAPLAELRRQLHDAARGNRSLPFRLRIRDIDAPVAGRVTRLVDDPRGFSFDLEFPVSLAAYRLQPPTVMGFIRVADEVKVKVSVQLPPLPTPGPP